jgi:hypothetical protein
MSDCTPEQRSHYIKERDELLCECQQLLWQVSRHPYSIKLLIGVRNQLRLFAAYKQPRWEKERFSSQSETSVAKVLR